MKNILIVFATLCLLSLYIPNQGTKRVDEFEAKVKIIDFGKKTTTDAKTLKYVKRYDKVLHQKLLSSTTSLSFEYNGKPYYSPIVCKIDFEKLRAADSVFCKFTRFNKSQYIIIDTLIFSK